MPARDFISRNLPAAIAAYSEAIRLDPHYALAIASRSMVLSFGAAEAATPAAAREGFGNAMPTHTRRLSLRQI